jgi:TRAP-type uncharacterized transport system substrate-binding protein
MTKIKSFFSRAVAVFTEVFGFSRAVSLTLVLFTGAVTFLAIYWFIHSAPPRSLTITSGPPGSVFEKYAERYRTNLLNSGVTLNILPSEGSAENLQRLENPASGVDVGFVQGGEADGNTEKLVSLGSISYQPLLIFYRSATPISLLSGLNGRRLAIGPEGSGTRALGLLLLQTNGIVPGGTTQLLDLDAGDAASALLDGKVDAVFLMGDSASTQIMRTLTRSADIRLFDFAQADAYTRRFDFLSTIRLPEGSLDLGKDIPAQDVTLVGPTVELVARKELNPVLSDLLLDAARVVHGNVGLLQSRNEFPAPLQSQFKISPDATRYYHSGKSFLYRYLPFWIASLLNRVLVAFVPMMLVLIPGLRLIPTTYKWRKQMHIYRWYRALLKIERELGPDLAPAKRKELLGRLDDIEKAVKQMKLPASFADQYYGLLGHIDYVRERLAGEQ